MRNHQITNLGMPQNPEDAVNNRNADSRRCTLYDDLKMDSNEITNVRNPSNPQDVATKIYIDIHKPIIAVFAEQNGSLTEGNFEWSFGNGSSGRDHNHIRFPITTSGRIIRGKMSVDKFGRMPQSNMTNIDGVSATYVNNTFIRIDGTTTVFGSINKAGSTLTDICDPVHNHDVATKT